MSASVEGMKAQANEVATLVKEAKEYKTTSLVVLLMIGLGARGSMISAEMEKLKEVERRLAAALKPFETEAP